MALDLLDSLSIPGNPDKANEDSFAARMDAAVVFDGATGLGEPLLPGDSDAAWIARFGAHRLMAHLAEQWPPRDAIRHALTDAHTSFDGLKRREASETWELPFASMMLAVDTAKGIGAYWLGDCAIVVKRGDEPAFVVGEAFDRKANERARVARLAELKGLAPAAGVARAEYLPSLRRARNFVNTAEGGYLFGPNPAAAEHVHHEEIVAPPGTLALLATDGFLALVSEYARYDLDGLIAAAQSRGFEALGEELRAIEEGDPEGRQYPRFKKSDDATALLVRVV